MISGGGGQTSFPQGTLAARPAPTVPGQPYYATDTNTLYVTNGAGNAWQVAGTGAGVTTQNPQGGIATWPGLVAPYDPAMTDGNSGVIAGSIYGSRVVVPKSGVLHDLSIFVHTSAAGNFHLGVYDTGDALAGSRTLLYDSGSVAVGAAAQWQTVDPAIAVVAGQQLDLVFNCSSGAVTIERKSLVDTTLSKLPNNNFIPAAGGAQPKYNFEYDIGAFAALPATILEANCGGNGNRFLLVARVA